MAVCLGFLSQSPWAGSLFSYHGDDMAKRPRKSKSEVLQTALENAVSAADIKDVLQAMVTAAKGGDVEAGKLVLDRVLGKPSVAQKPTISGTQVNVNIDHAGRAKITQRLIEKLSKGRQQAADTLEHIEHMAAVRQVELADDDGDNSQQ